MLLETAEVRLTIGSRFEDLDLVDTVADAVLKHTTIPERQLEHTSLAIREAAANAIEHGNGPGSDRRVDIQIVMEEDHLTVVVRDQGKGFDLDKVADPLAPENLMKPRGRGIFLTRQFMDEIHYAFDDGTIMTMRKNFAAVEPESAANE